MTYNLRNGYQVITTKVDTGTEFVTFNPEGETISTVTLEGASAESVSIMLGKLSH